MEKDERIKHYKSEIKKADEDIKLVNDCKKDHMSGKPLDDVLIHAKSNKKIYENLLEDESH